MRVARGKRGGGKRITYKFHSFSESNGARFEMPRSHTTFVCRQQTIVWWEQTIVWSGHTIVCRQQTMSYPNL
ncbi:hypothetical protein [Alloprevotella tannerae]|uniref:hypothetical protein n=1 Tax=Alloprevotella tannerae TaxID=76122 RepID=UPI0028F17202|nr:hypothetical protein [Alloprevotella tannerae]